MKRRRSDWPRDCVITFRLAEPERECLTLLAMEHGMPLSEFCRYALGFRRTSIEQYAEDLWIPVPAADEQ